MGRTRPGLEPATFNRTHNRLPLQYVPASADQESLLFIKIGQKLKNSQSYATATFTVATLHGGAIYGSIPQVLLRRRGKRVDRQ